MPPLQTTFKKGGDSSEPVLGANKKTLGFMPAAPRSFAPKNSIRPSGYDLIWNCRTFVDVVLLGSKSLTPSRVLLGVLCEPIKDYSGSVRADQGPDMGKWASYLDARGTSQVLTQRVIWGYRLDLLSQLSTQARCAKNLEPKRRLGLNGNNHELGTPDSSSCCSAGTSFSEILGSRWSCPPRCHRLLRECTPNRGQQKE